MDKQLLFKPDIQREILKLISENYNQEVADAQAASQVAHKELLYWIIQDETLKALGATYPRPEGHYERRANYLQKIEDTERQLSLLEQRLEAFNKLTDHGTFMPEAVLAEIEAIPM